jgi:hypothetical protein
MANSESGFRWEEGINEWVVATPAFKLKVAQRVRLSPSDVDSDCETPIRQGIKRQKRDKVRSCRFSRVSDLTPASPEEHCSGVRPPIRRDHQNHDEALTNYCSSRESESFSHPRYGGKPIRKLRRLGHELLSSRQSWKIFEHSDDELHSTVATSSDSAQFVLLELPNSKSSSYKQGKKFSFLERPPAGRDESLQEQSNDELGL